MTQHSGKSFPLRKPFAAAGELVGAALGHLLVNVFPALGLLLSLGLVAAVGVLFLFYRLPSGEH